VVERPRGGHKFFKTQYFGLIAGTWLTGDRAGPLGESGDKWLGRSGSGYVASRHLQVCSPRLYRLRIIRLTPASKYWTYRLHAGDMGSVSWCSYITIGLKPLSPTPGSSHGRRNEVTSIFRLDQSVFGCQDDGWASEKLSCMGTAHRKCTSGMHELEWEVYVTCWSGFALQGVYRFESSWLSDMSNRLFMTVIT
jgi:hypothetical protein